jgi:nicotine blue oxidoreductase
MDQTDKSEFALLASCGRCAVKGEFIVAGVVPAAGASRRMGRDKRLIQREGVAVLELTVASLRRGGVGPIVVVLEPSSPCLELPGLAGVIVAINPLPERGMLSSIRAGLARVPAEAGAAAVLPGDHPFVPPEATAALVDAFARSRPPLLVPCYGASNKRGHPLVIRRDLFAEAAACDDAVGLRQLLARRAADVVEVHLDLSGADDDLDEPGDLERLRR